MVNGVNRPALIMGLTPRGNKRFEPVTSSAGDSFTSGSEPLELTLGVERVEWKSTCIVGGRKIKYVRSGICFGLRYKHKMVGWESHIASYYVNLPLQGDLSMWD
jgi:hypothetical protein